jgi:hypothetical protein
MEPAGRLGAPLPVDGDAQPAIVRAAGGGQTSPPARRVSGADGPRRVGTTRTSGHVPVTI